MARLKHLAATGATATLIGAALTVAPTAHATQEQATTGPAVHAAVGACESWHDDNTYGYACGGHPGQSYRAVVLCKNGHRDKGPWQNGTSWKWSYAYCTRVNSSLGLGILQWK
ncbi:hypothetical protein ACWEQN_43255 [Streptomyces sp. NPDC004129]